MQTDLNKLNIFSKKVQESNGVYINDFSDAKINEDKNQTNAAFSTKWAALKENDKDDESWKNFGKNWYLKLYGFENEDNFFGGFDCFLLGHPQLGQNKCVDSLV